MGSLSRHYRTSIACETPYAVSFVVSRQRHFSNRTCPLTGSGVAGSHMG